MCPGELDGYLATASLSSLAPAPPCASAEISERAPLLEEYPLALTHYDSRSGLCRPYLGQVGTLSCAPALCALCCELCTALGACRLQVRYITGMPCPMTMGSPREDPLLPRQCTAGALLACMLGHHNVSLKCALLTHHVPLTAPACRLCAPSSSSPARQPQVRQAAGDRQRSAAAAARQARTTCCSQACPSCA